RTEDALRIRKEPLREYRSSKLMHASRVHVKKFVDADLVNSEFQTMFDSFTDFSARFSCNRQHVGIDVHKLLSKCDVEVILNERTTRHRGTTPSDLQEPDVELSFSLAGPFKDGQRRLLRVRKDATIGSLRRRYEHLSENAAAYQKQRQQSCDRSRG